MIAFVYLYHNQCGDYICIHVQELHLLQGWIDDDPKLFTADILLNLLLSYRDIQVGGWDWALNFGGTG